MNSLDHALSHWIFVGDTTKYKRKNSNLFPAVLLNYKPFNTISIRFARTKDID